MNEALRRGLREMNTRPNAATAYRTPAVSLGRCLVASIDDIQEVLAASDRHRESPPHGTVAFF